VDANADVWTYRDKAKGIKEEVEEEAEGETDSVMNESSMTQQQINSQSSANSNGAVVGMGKKKRVMKKRR